jgi:Ca2+-binding EF-hand superfamily protein
MPGFIKQAFLLSMIPALFVPVQLAAQNSSQGAAASSGKTASVLDRIREKMKETRTPENRAKRWFDALDLDKNEEITKRELFESIRRRFDTMDRTRDKFVSKSEYLSLRKDRASGEKRFGALDSNSDGRLSMSEFASPADWRFDRIDRNLDGKVSRTEAARLFDRPVGEALPDERGECFYVERQVVRVKEKVAEEFKKRGYPKADCSWTPEVTDELKTKKFSK